MISIKELNIDPSSYVDPNGRVFTVDNEIYRLLHPNYTDTAKELFSKGIVERLISNGLLVNSTIVDTNADAFMLHHRRIDRISYCVEWPFLLLKKAALHTLRLSLELLEDDLYLQDAYPWNIFFEGTQSIFIDFTSIVKAESTVLWPAYQQFCQFFLFPLYLYSCNQGKISRALLHDYLHGVSYRDFEKLVPFTFKLTHPLVYLKRIVPEKLGAIANHSERVNTQVISKAKGIYTSSKKLKNDRICFYNDLMSDVEAIEIPGAVTRWTTYYEDEAKELNRKLNLVSATIKQLEPSTVLDVGCNAGEFSILAAESGASVVSFDNDESCVERLARRADELGLNILPLVMDFSNPTPSFGWSSQQFPVASERFKSDMVMALALIHHLVFHQRQNFDRIISELQRYLGKWLIIEFVEITDSYIQRWSVNFERFEWYTKLNFEKSLQAYFSSVKYVGTIADTRHLYLCEN